MRLPLVRIAIVAGTTILASATLDDARAETCAVPEGASPALAQVDVARRTSFLETASHAASEDAARWGWFWRASFQTSAIASFGLTRVFTKDADKIDALSSALKSSVAFAFSMIFILPAEMHRFDPQPDAPSCARVAFLETRLAEDAAGEAKGKSIVIHLLGGVFNVAAGITTGIVSKRWSTAILGMVTGNIVGELRIYTQPMTATNALEAYRAGRLESSTTQISAGVIPVPGGAVGAFGFTF